MSIKGTLKVVNDIAVRNKISEPMIVGGLPRDVHMGKEIKTSDVDLTTNAPDVLRLGILTANALNVTFEVSDDGHATVFTDEFDLDFSSNFVSDKVLEYLTNEEDKKFAEAFSRDFTINTLHMKLSNWEIIDPTKKGFHDIKNKVIRTPVPPDIVFQDDPRRIYRAINLAVRYDFSIAPEIKEYALDHPELFTVDKIKDKYISLKMVKALKVNPKKTIKLLKELNLFKNVPLVGYFKDILIEHKMLADYLDGSNV